MEKKKRTFDPIALVIVLLAVAVPCLFFYGVYSLTKFHVHTNLSESTKNNMADFAKKPGIAPYIERYGDRGPMDIDYQIETCSFASLGALCNAVNDRVETVDYEIDILLGEEHTSGVKSPSAPAPSKIEQAVLNGTPRDGRDLMGKKVKVYTIESYSPMNDKTYQTDASYSQEYYWDWSYSVFEYPDGTYRYVVNILTS